MPLIWKLIHEKKTQKGVQGTTWKEQMPLPNDPLGDLLGSRNTLGGPVRVSTPGCNHALCRKKYTSIAPTALQYVCFRGLVVF